MIKSKVIIIGAGPAGCSAAIQLKRFGIDFMLVEKDTIGGLIRNANLIENYPGFYNGISGLKFADLLTKHLEKLNIEITKDEILTVNYEASRFEIKGKTNTYISDYLIVATGTVPIIPGDIVIPDSVKKYICYEIADIKAEKKTIAIIGGGDAAFDYALSLAEKNTEINIFIRGNHVKALHKLQKLVNQNEKISVQYCHQLKEIKLSGNGIDVVFDFNGQSQFYYHDLLVFAIGRRQSDSMIEINNEMRSNLIKITKLHLAGDIVNGKNRQAVIASGNGVEAAMKIYHSIQNESN